MRKVAILSVVGILFLQGCTGNDVVKNSPIPEKQITEFKNEAMIALPDGVSKELVVANCVHCHSYKLISQNSATREGWKSMIVWMQETQGLWPLGQSEDQILDYLSENFAPKNAGRRAPLMDIDWYELQDGL